MPGSLVAYNTWNFVFASAWFVYLKWHSHANQGRKKGVKVKRGQQMKRKAEHTETDYSVYHLRVYRVCQMQTSFVTFKLYEK